MQEDNNLRDYDKEIYLTTAAGSFEAETLEALLRSNGIPVLKKYREAGAYLEIYMGVSNFGVDIYVPSSMYERAKEILESEPQYEQDTQQQDYPEEDSGLQEADYKKRQRALTWLMIVIFVPGVLGALIYAAYRLFIRIAS